MERREEAETYHPAVHTQRRQQIVRTLDEVLRVPLIAQHHVLRGSLALRLRRRLASRNTPSVVRLVCAGLCAVARVVLNLPLGRLADTVGRKPLMRYGTLVTAAGSIGTGAMFSPPAPMMSSLMRPVM